MHISEALDACLHEKVGHALTAILTLLVHS